MRIIDYWHMSFILFIIIFIANFLESSIINLGGRQEILIWVLLYGKIVTEMFIDVNIQIK